jgi:predicted RNase H-like nuclease (RuvC/YqgF family)
MSKVTVIQAAFLTGKARQTINKFTQHGRLSHSLNEEGAKVIDVSELQRVFPLVKTMEELAQAELAGEGVNAVTPHPSGAGEELAVMKVKYENAVNECRGLREERERERRQFQDEIEHLRSTVETTGKAMLRLTDQSQSAQEDRQTQDNEMAELKTTVKKLQYRSVKLERELQEQKKRGFLGWLRGGQGASEKPAPTRVQQKTT